MSGSSGKFMCSERNLAQSVVSIAMLSLATRPNPFGAGLSHTCLWHTCLCCCAAAVSCASPAELQSRAGSCFSAAWLGAQLCASAAKSKGRGAQLVFSPALCSDLRAGSTLAVGASKVCLSTDMFECEHGSAGVGCINSSNKV